MQSFNSTSLRSLSNPSESAFFIIQPGLPFSPQEEISIESFVSSGGLLIIAANNGTANQLLSSIGSAVYLSNLTIVDAAFNYGQVAIPIVTNISSTDVPLGDSLVLDRPVLINFTSTNANAISYSSNFSYLGNVKHSSVSGPFPVVAMQKIGAGELLLISSPGPLLNSFFDVFGDHVFFSNLVGSRISYIDVAHWKVPFLLPILQQFLNSALSGKMLGINIFNFSLYTLIALLVAITMSMIFVTLRSKRRSN